MLPVVAWPSQVDGPERYEPGSHDPQEKRSEIHIVNARLGESVGSPATERYMLTMFAPHSDASCELWPVIRRIEAVQATRMA